ncbi:MAG: hypothetical protein IPM38_05835 [Ignavibacteria bacterium]|nr:hypothetical protein [Ignavibacteria bacterium]
MITFLSRTMKCNRRELNTRTPARLTDRLTAMLGLIQLCGRQARVRILLNPLSSMIGRILTSSVHVLFVTPVIFVIVKEYFQKKGKLKKSEMAKFCGSLIKQACF